MKIKLFLYLFFLILIVFLLSCSTVITYDDLVISWIIDSEPAGADIYQQIISEVDEIENSNEMYLGTTPFREKTALPVKNITSENSGKVFIKIIVRKDGYKTQTEKVSCKNIIQTETLSVKYHLKEKTVPEKEPKNVWASYEDYKEKIIIKWEAVEDATKYQIYKSEEADDNYNLLDEVTRLEYVDNSVERGNIYYYKVKAGNEIGWSDYFSNSVKGKTIDLPPEQSPQNTQASYDDYDDHIVVQWEEVENADYYEIYRSTRINGTYRKVGKSEKPEYTDYNVDIATSYYYKIKAINSGGESPFSDIVEGKTMTPPPPKKPVDMTATYEDFYNMIKVEWEKCEGAKSYKVYGASDVDNNFRFLEEVDETDYLHIIENDRRYYFKIKSVSEWGESDFSDYIEGKTKLNLIEDSETSFLDKLNENGNSLAEDGGQFIILDDGTQFASSVNEGDMCFYSYVEDENRLIVSYNLYHNQMNVFIFYEFDLNQPKDLEVTLLYSYEKEKYKGVVSYENVYYDWDGSKLTVVYTDGQIGQLSFMGLFNIDF